MGLRSAVLLCCLPGLAGCSSSSDPENQPKHASGGSTALANDGGASEQVDIACGENPKEGQPCSELCSVPCGFLEMGTKTCTCLSGIYDNCSCPRPDAYQGAPYGPSCTAFTKDGSGLTSELEDKPCTTEWQQCIGEDPVTTVTPQGCACLSNPALGGALTWICQSTNQWFVPE